MNPRLVFRGEKGKKKKELALVEMSFQQTSVLAQNRGGWETRDAFKLVKGIL